MDVNKKMLLIGCLPIECRHKECENKKIGSVMVDVRPRFGLAVRQRRKRVGVSQEDFADLCGLHRTYMGGVERGERNISLVNIEKIARALKVSLSQLLRGV